MLSSKKSSIINSRLREARIVNGKTAKDVAKEIGISAQALSQYERGKTTPSEVIFSKLFLMYGLPASFYLKKKKSKLNDGVVFFRSFSAATKLRREIAFVKADWLVHDVVEEIDKKIKFPEVDPLFERIKQSINVDVDNLDFEAFAKIIRREWKLGYGPINDLMYEFEKRGIVIAKIDLDDDIDGFSFWSNGRPFMFVNKNNNFFRLRMSMAHELCHLFFHDAIEDVEGDLKKIESDAKNFAGAFLLPDVSFRNSIVTTNLNELLFLKSKLKVSLAAMVKRCEQLGLISEERSISLNKQISFKHWRKIEPYDDMYMPEEPRLLKQAIILLVEKGVYSKNQLIDLFSLDLNFVEESCCMDKGYFSGQKIIPFEIRR